LKILIVNQFFWPDVAATGQLITDLTRHLGSEHEVTVICSGGSYNSAEATDEPPPVKIIRVPGPRYRPGALARLLSYVTFFLGALWHEFRVPRQDVVVTMTTPPLLAIGGTLVKLFRGSRHYVWEMDLFPDAFVALGALSERSWVLRILGWIEDSCRLRSDGIIALGPCMRRRLIARGIPKRLVHVVENWADGRSITAKPFQNDGPIHVLYSGNLGLSHDTDTILNTMRHFRQDPRFLFTFAGGGVKRAEVERACVAEGIQNCRFLPYVDRDDMDGLFSQADIGLVTEHPGHIGIVVPSKLYGLMAAGRPVLFIGPRRSTADLVIRRFRCGWQTDPGDWKSVTNLLESLAVNREELRVLGARARSAFDRHYDLPHGVGKIAAVLSMRPAETSHASGAPTAVKVPATL
jgi:glycosyltransferase involved in cell wall biosynthesis